MAQDVQQVGAGEGEGVVEVRRRASASSLLALGRPSPGTLADGASLRIETSRGGGAGPPESASGKKVRECELPEFYLVGEIP